MDERKRYRKPAIDAHYIKSAGQSIEELELMLIDLYGPDDDDDEPAFNPLRTVS